MSRRGFFVCALVLSACVPAGDGDADDADDAGDDSHEWLDAADSAVDVPDLDVSGVSPEEDAPDAADSTDVDPAELAVTGAVTAVNGPGWRIEFVANDPKAGSADLTLETHYAKLVDAVPKGSEIRSGFYDMGSSATSKPYVALAAAATRGVTVRLVHDGKANTAGTNAKRLAAVVGGDDAHFCKHATNTACTSTKPGTIMHSKYSLLSRTKDSTGKAWTYVTWLASANFSATSGKNSQNNAIVVYGDQALYTALRDSQFGDQFHQDGPTSSIAAGITGDAGVTVYGNPFSDASTDVWALRLSPFVKATKQTGCRVVAASPDFSDGRLAVANQLATLKAHGCSVTVYTRAASRLGPKVKAALDARKIPHLVQPTLHDKMVAIRARTSNTGNLRPFVFAGSLNLKTSSSDELLVKVESQTLFDAAVRHLGLD